MLINANGNVGIGTVGPSTLLHVGSGGDTPLVTSGGGSVIYGTNAGATNIAVRDSTNDVEGLYYAYSGGVLYGAVTNHNVTIRTNNLDRITVTTGGNVGIGVAPASGNKLDVAGNINASGTINAAGLNINNSPVTSSQWTTSGSTINYTGGNIGIGATSPGEKLQIHGNLKLSSDAIPNGVRALTPTGWGYAPNAYRVLMVGASSGNETVSIGYDPSGITNGSFWGDGREVLFRDGASFTTPNAGANTFYYNSLVLKGGNVGIGIPTPGYKLDVQGGQLNASGGLCIAADCKTAWSQVGGGSQWTSGTNSISYSAGNVGIGTTPTPTSQYKLDINGATNVTGNLNATGTITGGNIVAKYQDVAEWVPSSEQLPTGTVVVLDSTKSNQVISSTQAYDTRVAGVISEQPGIALGESGAGKVLVATTGRVLVEVDASKSPIRIGDLLVTSDVPGVAMKSEPVNLGGVQLHRPGTLIGKALEPLEKGSGRILVLLSLQ